MKRLYQNTIDGFNIGHTSNKEFAAFYEDGAMHALYRDGSTKRLFERDDTAVLEQGILDGRIKTLTEDEFVTESLSESSHEKSSI